MDRPQEMADGFSNSNKAFLSKIFVKTYGPSSNLALVIDALWLLFDMTGK